jgi:hypothetical protein
MASFNKSDLRDIKMFLARVIARGYDEEERLVHLIEKIDKQLHKEVAQYGATRQAARTSTQGEELRSTKNR